MLTTGEIKRFIEEDISSERKRLARIGQRYYDAEHDILNYRMFYYNADGVLVEDKGRSNSKIPHPFFTELVDQCAAYILSGEENPIRSDADGLQYHLDKYFDDEFWAEFYDLITDVQVGGSSYLYGYKNEENRMAFQCAEGAGVVEVRAKDTDDNCDYIIRWWTDRVEKNRKKIRRIRVHDKDRTWFCVWDDHGIELDREQTINPKLNHIWRSEGSLYGKSLGFMPYWRLDYNKQRRSALSPIKALIDDYDVMECGLSNNLKDMDTPIMLVRGYDGSDLDELQQNLKTKKIVGVDDDGGIEMKTVNIPYEARKIKADEDEKNIYRFGMGLNASQVGDGNITNIVIKSRYALLDLKSKKIIRRAKKFLKPIIKVVLDEINEANKTAYQYSDVWIEFDPVIPTNELEKAQIALTEAQTRSVEINTIKTIALDIGDEQKLRLICDELEISFNDVKAILEETNDLQNLLGAENILQALEVNDDE